ncbi:MAG: helix-turn-helix domain-containing protein [Sulfuricellaceae bacterium]
MAWKPNVDRQNRVTLAIAGFEGERFTQSEIVQRSGSVRGTVSANLKEMERQGMIVVCRVGQFGIKIWRKTDKYRAPGAEAPDVTAPEDLPVETSGREYQAHACQTCLAQLEAAMRGWQGAGAERRL